METRRVMVKFHSHLRQLVEVSHTQDFYAMSDTIKIHFVYEHVERNQVKVLSTKDRWRDS